jgi:hypothetical protein
LLQFAWPDPVCRSNGLARDPRRLGIMMKRAAFLGFSAVMMIAANSPGAAEAWDYDCYRSHCYPRHSEWGWRGEYPRYRSESHYHYHYSEYPRYHYHYYDYPRENYVRYRGYDPYDRGYYRYYSASRYDDSYGYYGYDW